MSFILNRISLMYPSQELVSRTLAMKGLRYSAIEAQVTSFLQSIRGMAYELTIDDVQGASRIAGGVKRVFAILQTWHETARMGQRCRGAHETVSERNIVLEIMAANADPPSQKCRALCAPV